MMILLQNSGPATSKMKYSLPLILLSFISAVGFCHALDTISTTVSIRDGQSLISANGTFELGFFSPGDPSRRYVGIWYRKITVQTVVWVANRLTPLTDSAGELKVTAQGSVELREKNGTGAVVWSTNSSAPNGGSPVAQLLDTGNLVVMDGVGGRLLWQSFEYPSDTLLAGMKLGRNRTSGFDRFLTAWRSTDDPYPGNYTFKLDPGGYPQLLLEQGDTIKFNTGPWNGIRWSGTPNLTPNPFYAYQFVLKDDEMYYKYELRNDTVITRLFMSSSGVLQRYTWIDRMQGWLLYLTEPIDNCDTHSLCGPYGSCNINNSPVCGCLEGFNPKNPSEWDLTDWTGGCVRRTVMECGKEIFVKYPSVRLPDTQHSWFNRSMNLQECEAHCRSNCSCMAYSSLDISGGGVGTGCLQWPDGLIDIREYKEKGQDLYIRMSASETGLLQSTQKKHKVAIIAGVASGVVVLVLALLSLLVVRKFRKKDKSKTVTGFRLDTGQDDEGHNEDLELPLFDMATIAAATDNFSLQNKIGEGGFGPVYKGRLNNGQEIAVKKLSRNSKQGLDEFKNEVLYVAKLQHRNLAKLLGCCIHEENLLVYEYMPNKSLDSFLFDKDMRRELDWSKRFNIVNGIARGLLYLHQDSRLRIIHRDLKASNILLDNDMNPKISDFGLAKSFGGNQTEANTNRVVGTYGYMSPEYAIDGVFSIKSDVFSYGVLVLETVSGKRNRGFNHPDHRHNLLGHAWRLFSEGKPLDLLDPLMNGSCNMSEAARCIQMGLLCVQRNPEDRPTMAKVAMMLGSEIELPGPKEPGFFNERKLLGDDTTSSSQAAYSANEITMTLLTAR